MPNARRPMYEPDAPNPGSKAPDYGGSLFPNPSALVIMVVIMLFLFIPSWS